MRPASITTCALAATVLVATAAGAFAQDRSSKINGLALSNEKPIQIESDNLEIREQEKRALFDGNVKVVQGTMTLKAAHMVVFYKGDSGSVTAGKGDIDKIEVNGSVSLLSGTQSARGDEGAFDMRSEVLTLKGKQVVLSDGSNIFTGCKLTVQMKSGQAKLDSCGARVRISIDPQSRKTN